MPTVSLPAPIKPSPLEIEYPYRVEHINSCFVQKAGTFSYSANDIVALVSEMEVWLRANTIDVSIWGLDGNNIRLVTKNGVHYLAACIYFKQASDAAAFMLRWGIGSQYFHDASNG